MKKRKPASLKKTTTAAKSAKAKSIFPAKLAHIPAQTHSVEQQKNVPGQLVVRVKEDVTDGLADVMSASISSFDSMSLPSAVESPFTKLQEEGLIREVKPIFSRSTGGKALSVAPQNVAAAFAMSVHDSEADDLRGITLLRLKRTTDLDKVEKDLNNTPGIDYAHQVPRRWITARKKPNDPLFNRQWGLPAINWLNPEALPDASAVKVGVLDTGVDLTHRDLKDVVRNYFHEGVSSEDIVGHGTHVSGVIAADINNDVGLSGICRCDLNFWKIFTDTPDPADGEFYVDEVMYQRALNAARDSGMQVVNLSIGGGEPSTTERILFRRLVEAGVTVVAAMGNEFRDGNPIEFPSAYPGVIAVGAVGQTKRRALFSNTGPHISIVAPGKAIVSTLPMKASAARHSDQTVYGSWDGTSMATPHVAAVAALILALNPNFTPAQVRERLISSATKLTAMGNKKKTDEYGHGLLNVEAALSSN